MRGLAIWLLGMFVRFLLWANDVISAIAGDRRGNENAVSSAVNPLESLGSDGNEGDRQKEKRP